MASTQQYQEQVLCPGDQNEDDTVNYQPVDELDIVGEEGELDRFSPENTYDSVNIRRCGQRPLLSEREFPPPITLLGQAGDLRCQMPWVFRRFYENHRLVIRMQRARRHEFLRAHRSDGRLRLNVVRLVDLAAPNPPQQAPGSIQDSFDATGHAAGVASPPPRDGPDHQLSGNESDEKCGLVNQVAADAWEEKDSGRNVMGLAAGACSITSSILHLQMPTMRRPVLHS